MENKIGEMVRQKHEKLMSRRTNWDSHWKEIADYFIPEKNNIYHSQVPGEKKGNKLFSSTAIQANEFLASALHGMLTNPTTVWFGLSTGDKEIDKLKEVQQWLQGTTHKIISVLNNSNFQTEIHEVYLDLGSFGTSVLRVEEDDESVVRFSARPIYEAYIDENFRGQVDTVSYEYKKSVRHLAQEFGAENLSKELKDLLESDSSYEVCVIHLVQPNSDFNPFGNKARQKKFVSYHVVKETGDVIKIKGFDENPYIVSRWIKAPGEIYGRSPAMKALADVKMLNVMKKTIIEGAQLAIRPPLQVPDDGVLLPIVMKPGGTNYYRAGTKDRIEPLNTGARPDLGEALIEEVKQSIREAFFIDQLMVTLGDRATATEVMQRRDEQLRIMSPILGRQEYENLRPLIERVFSIMVRKNLIDPAPSVIQGKNLQIRYTSDIARAQRTADADKLARVFGAISPLAGAKPEMLDNFNEDEIVRDLAESFGLPADYMEDTQTISQIRQARARAQEAAANTQLQGAQLDNAQKASQVGA